MAAGAAVAAGAVVAGTTDETAAAKFFDTAARGVDAGAAGTGVAYTGAAGAGVVDAGAEFAVATGAGVVDGADAVVTGAAGALVAAGT